MRGSLHASHVRYESLARISPRGLLLTGIVGAERGMTHVTSTSPEPRVTGSTAKIPENRPPTDLRRWLAPRPVREASRSPVQGCPVHERPASLRTRVRLNDHVSRPTSDLGEVGLDLAGRQASAATEVPVSSTRESSFLPLLDDLRFESAVAVAGHGGLHRPGVGQYGPAAGPVAGVAVIPARGVVRVMTEVVGDLALESGLQQPLGQLLQQPPSPVSCGPSAWARGLRLHGAAAGLDHEAAATGAAPPGRAGRPRP